MNADERDRVDREADEWADRDGDVWTPFGDDTWWLGGELVLTLDELTERFGPLTRPGAARTINDHKNDLGDWCPWSLTHVSANYPDERCPAGCRGSYVEGGE